MTATTISELLATQAAKYGEKVFLYFGEQRISFRQMADITDKVAAGLQRLGVQAMDKVCLLLPNCLEYLYLFLGIPKLGAASVPINTALKRDEVSYIVENSDACAIVTSPLFLDLVLSLRPFCPKLQWIIVVGNTNELTPFSGMVKWEDLLAMAEAETLIGNIHPENLMSIVYTSGTTGRPKGVMLTQLNYWQNSWQTSKAIGLQPDDRAMCILPLFHVNGQVVTVLAPLQAGASAIVTEGFSPRTFFNYVARYQATLFSGVPTIYSILLHLPDREKYDLRSLRLCICGGAPMPVEVFNRFEQSFKVKVVEGYGLSEGTCASAINPVNGQRKIGSIGLPFPGQELSIFNHRNEEMPVGSVGEIVIRGTNVMQGYYKNPTATAETLIDDWLHTGDLGYRDSEGYYYIVGRKKEMIIRGGENIYPKEIEEWLYRHPEIQECAVIGLPDPIWGEEVAVVISVIPRATLVGADVIAYCQKELADYKCPRRVLFMEELPKTATGKIQKNKLVAMFSPAQN
jgi:long-chain acyl-CoA synthetase